MGMLSPTSPPAKWLGFVTAVWVQAISGNNYTFSNYSDALKSLMALTQLQLNNLSVAKDVGKAFGLLAGIASDRLPSPVILLIGSIEGFVGYGVQWLVVSRRIQPLPYWAMCIFMCMGGNSTTWMNTAILVTCIRNFRKNRGPVSGILKGYVGLSTAIFTDICSALFADDPAKFLVMLAVIPFVVCLTAIIFLREIPPSSTATEENDDTKYFGIINVLAVVIALYLLAFDVTGAHGRLFSQVFAAVLLVILASPISIPIYLALKNLIRPCSEPKTMDIERNVTESLLAKEVKEPVVEAEVEKNVEVMEFVEKRRPVLGEEHTIIEALKTLDFWILFVSFLCGVGTGLTVMNNMGQMGLALGYTDVSIFVSFTSIWGFFGRILSGWVSEYFIKRAGTPRPIWNAASQILMAVGYTIMAIAMPGSLYVGSIVVGICYGVRIAVSVPTASELFGLKYYGLIYNILILNLPLGSFLFSGLLAGFLYDSEASRTAGGGNTCLGAHCYRLVFVVMAIACIIGFDGPLYDSSAYTQCKLHPEEPLYNGGILKDQVPNFLQSILDNGDQVSYPTFLLQNLTEGNRYCFSVWIKIKNADSALVRASLVMEETNLSCIGTVIAKQGCWSFLKGGFVLTSSSRLSKLNLQDSAGRDYNIEIASASLQPFTKEQWGLNQQTKIYKERKRAVIIHVSDRNGAKLQGAEITVEQVSKDFPFGSAIAKTIIGNSHYQKWFTERFNAAVFENELKWDATEPKPGQVNYTIPDQMLEFVRANQIITRGHNIFWENPKSSPQWILNLSSPDLQSAVTYRIESRMSRYKEEFIHWDVSNEMLHFDFYEQRLGPNATLLFFEKAHQIDPLATLFMNEYNVVETCDDVNSTVDTYISRMIELKKGGVTMDGIGHQGHFNVPNPPLMRAILDKLATLGLLIWLTEVDVSKQFSKASQVREYNRIGLDNFRYTS
ncbi:NUCLEAR FUSION DEFECTIVE 4-like [Olea europaea subsp. europaea]|uniref:NUCLEAR FUSION DEFECTIVE 4-like n=1 Tax=Olea europaea subsp. europaea TaxID=158383 RepID=A0A8S0UYR8_OLEEU|nr:NUCLEAR FUSION DEFECTIVE 4-like [Olea europaea subsp. europaea]